MSTSTISLTDAAIRYLVTATLREPPVLHELRQETRALPGAGMQISAEQGQFMRLLVQLLGARRALEVGVFTGYSSTCVALELPSNGQLIACDINAETTNVARVYWALAGVQDKIRLELGPAERTLRKLLANGHAESFDFAFIDADKTSSDVYYELCLKLLRTGGLIAVDNALWDCKVADESCTDADTLAMRQLNAKVTQDDRVYSSLVPIGDGLLLARKLRNGPA